MTSMTKAWMAAAAGESLEPGSIALPPLRATDVEIDVDACGLCHSDLHLINDDWQRSRYPLVPGHEVVGRVSRVGDVVHGIKTGQRVGVGWYCDACLECEPCNTGDDNLCDEALATCVERPGGFATQIRVNARFAHPIPDKISDAQAAPLLCAGVTVFSPLRRLLDQPSDVGVLGIGGLGHMAIQYAKAMGHRVTAIARTEAKIDDATRLGAIRFVANQDAASLERARGSLDLLLSTVSGEHDWAMYLRLLRPGGTLCLLGVPGNTISIPSGELLGQQKIVTGSSVGSRAMIRECLAFSASHSCLPWIVEWPVDKINDAVSALAAGKLRYRAVLTF